MKKIQLKGAVVGIAAVVGMASFGSYTTSAQSTPSQIYQTNLSALNDSGTTGTASIAVNGNEVRVRVNTTGASANLAHAQHIHIGGEGVCPDPSADTNNSGFVSTVEGQPFYGDVRVSLTTTGDTSASSGLAVDRFPTANSEGVVSYERTFTLPSGVNPSDLANAVIVQHGISKLYGDSTQYDGAPRSTLDDSLPFEATAPAACGVLSAVPTGGVATGGGATAGIEHAGLITLGSVSLVAALGLLAYRRYSADT